MSLEVFTIGHSTRSEEAFHNLLREFGIARLVDIRTYPGSRRVPQFNRESLEDSLARAGVAYVWLASLGGRRPAGPGPSPNQGLRNSSFRNYADYMLTSDFQAGILQLLEWAREARTAIMCAEAVYWRCHRRLVSDYLLARGVAVRHIMGPGQLRDHVLTEGAVIEGQSVRYPGTEQTLFD